MDLSRIVSETNGENCNFLQLGIFLTPVYLTLPLREFGFHLTFVRLQ